MMNSIFPISTGKGKRLSLESGELERAASWPRTLHEKGDVHQCVFFVMRRFMIENAL
jgi:hypothetical protein